MRKRRQRRRRKTLQFLSLLVYLSFCTQCFPMLKCTSTVSKSTTLMDCIRTNLTFSTTSRGAPCKTREFCTARGTTMKNFLMKLWKHLCLNLFSRGERKCLADPVASCCMVYWGVDFFSPFELLFPKMKKKLRLIRARHNFYIVGNNPDFSLGIVDRSFYTRRIALKDDYHKNRLDMLAYNPVEYTFLATLRKFSSFLPDKPSSFNETFSTMLQFVGMLPQ